MSSKGESLETLKEKGQGTSRLPSAAFYMCTDAPPLLEFYRGAVGVDQFQASNTG